jgi:hypothetical protein
MYAATNIKNVYYTMVCKESAPALKSLTSAEIELFLLGSGDIDQYNEILGKILIPASEKIEIELEKEGIRQELISKQLENESDLTDEQKVNLLRLGVATNYMGLAAYRLVYEEACRRSLTLVKKLQNPDIIEKIVGEELNKREEELNKYLNN